VDMNHRQAQPAQQGMQHTKEYPVLQLPQFDLDVETKARMQNLGRIYGK